MKYRIVSSEATPVEPNRDPNPTPTPTPEDPKPELGKDYVILKALTPTVNADGLASSSIDSPMFKKRAEASNIFIIEVPEVEGA
jgi:hypothetical protein